MQKTLAETQTALKEMKQDKELDKKEIARWKARCTELQTKLDNACNKYSTLECL